MEDMKFNNFKQFGAVNQSVDNFKQEDQVASSPSGLSREVYVGYLKNIYILYCLHLQLYRDSKDRYKQGQTKASLSLQHFLGVHSGFTLDKESNTIAIICQDVTVVLAFDTRERLIQWQVKIANNLGEDEQFLVQIQSAPARGKIPPGPARLHIQERQFCMTVGVPPRLVGYWQIVQLRRYGVVENRFCFEGGSRCGRGEGLYVLVTDQGKDISRAFQLAAEGKLYSRKRHRSRNALDSPRKRADLESGGGGGLEEPAPWPSCETRPDCDYADTASVTDTSDTYHQEGGVWTTESSMERCMSCISKLGAMSRSSTMVQTPGSGFTPAWTMETNNSGGCAVSAVNSTVPPSSLSDEPRNLSQDSWSHSGMSIATVAEKCQCPSTSKFSNPLLTLECSVFSPQRKKPKPPMPLPPSCTCRYVSPYGDYDVPKPFQVGISQTCPGTQGRPADEPCCSPTDELYDTPKNVKDRIMGEYGNYDVPQPANSCSCPQHGSTVARTVDRGRGEWRRTACPCHRVMSWMSLPLPYCRRGYGRENTAPTPKVRLSGEGKMPIASTHVSMPIYATIDRSKKTKCRQALNQSSGCYSSRPEPIGDTSEELKSDEGDLSTNYANIESSSQNKDLSLTTIDNSVNVNNPMYMNFEFAQSLEYYENSKDVLKRAQQINERSEHAHENSSKQPQTVLRNGEKYCTKCGHACKRDPQKPPEKQDDYLMMEPSVKEDSVSTVNVSSSSLTVKQFPGYLPMHPVPSMGGVSKTELLEYNFTLRRSLLYERAASSPSLCGPAVDRSKKNLEASLGTPGCSAHNVNHSVSATSSPYLRRRLLNSLGHIGDEEPRYNTALLRKRSNSADSARYLDDLESITERTVSSSPTQINNIESSKNTSIDSLCSQSLSMKRLNDVSLSDGSSISNIPPCTDETQNVEKNIDEVPYEKPEPDKPENVGDTRCSIRDSVDHPGLTVHIRRSSSVPCKSGHNRDSSSSNDSGVSIGSLKQRGSDFAEFELPLTTSMSSRRHHHALSQHLNADHTDCFHASLPRRSKSSDPLRELSFQFQDLKIATKSSSAEAEVPICIIKKETKGYLSPGGVPYIDSHSTSSGTSDMSDYIETLSLSSYSSSDTPDCLQFSRTAATTLRPRSGKEYHKIDRYFLDSDIKKSPYTTIPPVVENAESASYPDTKQGH